MATPWSSWTRRTTSAPSSCAGAGQDGRRRPPPGKSMKSEGHLTAKNDRITREVIAQADEPQERGAPHRGHGPSAHPCRCLLAARIRHEAGHHGKEQAACRASSQTPGGGRPLRRMDAGRDFARRHRGGRQGKSYGADARGAGPRGRPGTRSRVRRGGVLPPSGSEDLVVESLADEIARPTRSVLPSLRACFPRTTYRCLLTVPGISHKTAAALVTSIDISLFPGDGKLMGILRAGTEGQRLAPR